MTTGTPNTSPYACSRVSAASFVTPYGETGCFGDDSSPVAVDPYPDDVETCTNRARPTFTAARASRSTAERLQVEYDSKLVQLGTSPGTAARLTTASASPSSGSISTVRRSASTHSMPLAVASSDQFLRFGCSGYR